MINTSSDIHFLNEGVGLSDAVHDAVATVFNAIQKYYNFDRDPDTITSVNEKHLSFLKYFNTSFHHENQRLTKADVCSLFNVIKYSQTCKPSNEEIKEHCLANDPESKRHSVSRAYHSGIKLGIQLVFVRLWKVKALILPYGFEPPRCEWIFEGSFRELFFTRTLICVRQENSRFNPSLIYKSEKSRRMADSRAVCWLKLVLATSWYDEKDLVLNEIYEAREINANHQKGLTNSKLQFNLLIPVFLSYFGEKLGFNYQDFLRKELQYYEALNDTKNTNITRNKLGLEPVNTRESKDSALLTNEGKLLAGLSSIYDRFETINLTDLIKAILELTMTHLGNSSQVFEKVYRKVLPIEYHKAARYWLDLQQLYKGKKNYEQSKQLLRSFGYFNSYLFVYLPWWYRNAKYSEKLPDYPASLNKLNCEIFVNRWIDNLSELPLDYVQFKQLISQYSNWTNNTHYTIFHPFLMFLRWCENKKRRLPDAEHFENLLDTDDLPSYTKYSQSQKTPLPRRVFKMFMRYCYALESFQSQLLTKVSEGDIDPVVLKHLGGVNSSFISLTDTDRYSPNAKYIQPTYLDLAEFGLDQPVVSFETEGGKTYPIKSFYRFFFDNEYLVSGELKTLVYPGDLHICLLAMETGIRAAHLRWLDLDTFDMRVNFNSLDDYLHPLTVNTDKVKKAPWVSTVSSSVIRICLEQKNWRSLIENESFKKRVFYNGNSKSKFGAFRPLFSYSPATGTPTNSVDKCFEALLKSFHVFLADHGFKEDPMYRLRPPGHKYYGDVNQDIIETKKTNQNLEYTPLIYTKRTTVHASRNSVVKEKTRYLPENIVGEHITGQHPRLVTYYNLRDPEDHYADQALQWGAKPGETDFNIPLSDEVFNHAIPSNQRGSVMQKGIDDDPVQAVEAYGLISVHLITDEDGNLEDGVSMIKAKKHIKLACNPTHFCPFDNICPKEIIEEFGEAKPCALCTYAISGINHLPAISGAKDACFEDFLDTKEKLAAARTDNSTDLEIIAEIEDRCNQLAMYTNGWQYREKELLSKVESIKQGFNDGEYTVGKPEFIANMLEPIYFREEDNQAAYLLKRLRDCKAFPLLETKKIAAKFEMAKRKLMAVKDPHSALSFDVSSNPMKELYSLIQSYKELHNISDKQIIKALNMTPQSLMKRLNKGLEFGGEVEDD